MLWGQKLTETKPPNNQQSVFKSLAWRRSGLALVAVAALSIIPFYLFFNTRTPQQSPPSATLAEEQTAVTALGRLEPQGEVIIVSASRRAENPRIEQLLVQEGEWVKAGQIIAILDSRAHLEAQLKEAKQEVEVAHSRLEQVKAGAKVGEIEAQKAIISGLETELSQERKAQEAKIAGLEVQLLRERAFREAEIADLKAKLSNAQAECQRYEFLFQEGATGASIRDSKCLEETTTREQLKKAEATRNQTLETLQEQLIETKANKNKILETLVQKIREAQANLNKIEQVRPVDIQVAQAEVNKAIEVMKKAKAELDLAYVRTFREGRILKIHAKPGEIVGTEGIVELGKTNQMYVVAEVYETDISKVYPGQKATIISEFGGFTGELQGTVEKIGWKIGKKNILDTDPAADVDVRVLEVKIRIDSKNNQKIESLTNLQVRVKIHL